MSQVLYMMTVITTLFAVSVMSEASSPEEKPYKVEAAVQARTSTSRSVYRVPLLVFTPEGEHGTTGTRVAMPDVALARDDNFALSAIPKPAIEAPKPRPLPSPSPKRPPKAEPGDVPQKQKAPDAWHVTVTAYSSTKGQTDDTPFVTASGAEVRWGIVASNTLPFGTRIRFPDLYGDEEFVVKDRMNERFGHGRMDIWMPTTWDARQFGAKTTRVEIVAHPRG